MHSTCKCRLCPLLCMLIMQASSSCQPWKCKLVFLWVQHIISRHVEKTKIAYIFCKFCLVNGIGARIPTHGALNNKEPTICRHKDVKIHHWGLNLSLSSAAMLKRTNRMSTDPWRQVLIVGHRIRSTYLNVGITPTIFSSDEPMLMLYKWWTFLLSMFKVTLSFI